MRRDELQRGGDRGLEDARDGFRADVGGARFEPGDERVGRVAGDEEGVVRGDVVGQSARAGDEGVGGVVFVVDGLGAGGGGEVGVGGLRRLC